MPDGNQHVRIDDSSGGNGSFGGEVASPECFLMSFQIRILNMRQRLGRHHNLSKVLADDRDSSVVLGRPINSDIEYYKSLCNIFTSIPQIGINSRGVRRDCIKFIVAGSVEVPSKPPELFASAVNILIEFD